MRKARDQDIQENAALADLAAALRARAHVITRRWEDEARLRVGPEDRQLAGLLGQDTPDADTLLNALADSLENSTPPGSPQPPAAHLTPFGARDMLLAWQILRQAVFEELAPSLGRELIADEISALNTRIDQLMRDRVGPAIDAQLAQARIADDAQVRFMSYLSHDLRGNLNGVVLMLEVIRRELQGRPEFAESTEDLTMVRQSILETVGVMERHLQADRLRRGKVELHIQPRNLRAAVEQVAGKLPNPPDGKQVPVQIDVPADAAVRADAEALALALGSLIENASKHAAPPISVRARKRNDFWEIAVSDAGPGIDPQRLACLIDPLRRGELKDRGVGLLLAFHAAARLGGRLEAQSAPGQGSTFRLLLPAA